MPLLRQCVEAKASSLELEYSVPHIHSDEGFEALGEAQMKIGMFEIYLASPHTFSEEREDVLPMVLLKGLTLQVLIYFSAV